MLNCDALCDALRHIERNDAHVDMPFNVQLAADGSINVEACNDVIEANKVAAPKCAIRRSAGILPAAPRQSADELLKELMEEVLFVPPHAPFAPEFVRRAARIVDREVDAAAFLDGCFGVSRHSMCVAVRDAFGKIVAFDEEPLPADAAAAFSDARIGAKAGSWQAAAGGVPFAPGGFDDALFVDGTEGNAPEDAAIAACRIAGSRSAADFSFATREPLLTTPPGWTAGRSDAKSAFFEFDASAVALLSASSAVKQKDSHCDDDETENSMAQKMDALSVGDAADALLKTSAAFEQRISHCSHSTQSQTGGDLQPLKTHWAHVVDANTVPKDFETVVPRLAHEFPFELDAFQKQAIFHLERGDCVFVAAHTSAGKTVVAEYAIALAANHMTKAIYTSPIKALSNQKYRDFKHTFGDVGLLTGDVQISPEASCLIMTTEILRSMLYKGADLIRDVEFVIFDEVHYVNDIDRGHVWEEVIIMLPAHVNLILLSATVPNTVEFADWVGRTKRRDVYVVHTLKRPVPLAHHLYVGEACADLFKIVDENKNFLVANYKAAQRACIKQPVEGNNNGTGKKPPIKGNSSIGGGGGGRSAGPTKNTWIHLLGILRKKNLLPVVMFTFSKRRCDEYAEALLNLDFTDAAEKSAIHIFMQKSMARLNDEDANLPQIERVRTLLLKGIAVHHSGILPILKESVEILFCRGLVKVLFATETFAMGVNMPAKTVVFTGRQKHDGNEMRDLLPGEYTQMSGRAGRRGLDSTGVVILYVKDVPPDSNLKHMLLGAPTRLESQFKLTYNMILNLLRIEALKVEDMMKRSFSENDSQKNKGTHDQKLLLDSETALRNAPKLACRVCDGDIAEFYTLNTKLLALSSAIHTSFLAAPGKSKIFVPGVVIVINNESYRNCMAVYLRYIVYDKIKKIECVPLVDSQSNLNAKSSSFIEGDGAAPFFDWKQPVVPRDPIVATIDVEHVLFVSSVTAPVKFSIMGVPQAGDLRNLAHKAVAALFSLQHPRESEANLLAACNDLDVASSIYQRTRLCQSYSSFACLRCPMYSKHYAQYHVQRSLSERVAEIQYRIANNDLMLLPQYQQQLSVLKQLKFIDEDETVQLKGRVACEFNTVDELLTTEIIFENYFKDFEPAEIIALLSCMVFQEKSSKSSFSKNETRACSTTGDVSAILDAENGDNHPLPGNLQRGKDLIVDLASNLALIQNKAGLTTITQESYLEKLKWGMLHVVYEWANGMSFRKITELTDIAEGSIVRCIVRLDETAREVRNAARMMGDTQLLNKMEIASAAIKRDICFASSLYV